MDNITHYKKINDFIEDLNEKEINFLYKKISKKYFNKVIQVDFTVNGQKINCK